MWSVSINVTRKDGKGLKNPSTLSHYLGAHLGNKEAKPWGELGSGTGLIS